MYSGVTRVVLYVRVSTDEQVREGYSIEAQKASLLAYAKKEGYKVVGTYIDEGYTARRRFDKRKEFVRMLDDARAGRFDLILFIKLDRWFRSVADYYKIQEILEANNVNWKTTLEDYDTTTASGRLNLNIRLSVNQDEADRTSERIKFVFEKKVADGEVISGSAPLGYMIKDKRLVHDPDKKAIALEVFEAYMLHRSQVAAVRSVRSKFAYDINYNTVRNMLTNTIYCGSYRGNDSYCPPIVSRSDFDKVQRLLKERSIKRAPSGRVYIFSSLVRCGYCNRSMSGVYARNPKGREYLYYRCGNGVKDADCTNTRRIREDKIEEYLLNNLKEELRSYKVEYELRQPVKVAPMGDKRKIERKLDRLKELYINELIDLDTYKEDFEIYTSQLKAFEIEEEGPKVDFEGLENILNDDFLNMYQALGREDKKTLWLNAIGGVVVKDQEVLSIFFD